MEANEDQKYVAFLRDNGLQVTYQRLAIFRTLLNSIDHPTAEEIHRQVTKSFPMISLGTVYKTLEKFHEKGVIQRVQPFLDAARYEISADPHHHMICVKCQAMLDISEPITESSLSLPEGHGFQILGHTIIVRGYCPSCIE
jgi:Fur family peroxide stress response transcriptional regulator